MHLCKFGHWQEDLVKSLLRHFLAACTTALFTRFRSQAELDFSSEGVPRNQECPLQGGKVLGSISTTGCWPSPHNFPLSAVAEAGGLLLTSWYRFDLLRPPKVFAQLNVLEESHKLPRRRGNDSSPLQYLAKVNEDDIATD